MPATPRATSSRRDLLDDAVAGRRSSSRSWRRFIERRSRSVEPTEETPCVAVYGVASLFGFLRISEILPLVEGAYPGAAAGLLPRRLRTEQLPPARRARRLELSRGPDHCQRSGVASMKNREVYEKDPQTHTLLNQGVAKVTSGQHRPRTGDAPLRTHELRLRRPVRGWIEPHPVHLPGHLDKSEQPGVWVSGFFGSGKCHLVKMLQHLWTDFEFPDGARARGLAKLPHQHQRPAQRTLDQRQAARRAARRRRHAGGRGRVTASGLELLGIIFKSVGLPERLPDGQLRDVAARGGLGRRRSTAIAVSPAIDKEADWPTSTSPTPSPRRS